MANVQYTHNMGHVGFQKEPTPSSDTSTPPAKVLGKYTNIVGAVLSLSLVAGVGYWGYKLVMRDVTGIPVVRAAEGDMRERPEDPGGQLALHQGLAVNEVAADGQASGPVDRVVLAPNSTELSAEDQPATPVAAAPVQQPEPLDLASDTQASEPVALEPDVAQALEQGDINALVAELTDGVAPIEASPIAEDATVKPKDAKVITAAYTGPGLKLSLRPSLRPVKAVADPAKVTAVAAVIDAPARDTVKDVDPASLPAGTRLVQLAALDTEDNARAQWDLLLARYGDYMAGKDRVIMKATSGGRTFYRLRAMGFKDAADARRFCSALSAEGADCIPVSIK